MSRRFHPGWTATVVRVSLAAAVTAVATTSGCMRGAAAAGETDRSPAAAADALLAADRAYSDSSAGGDLVTGLSRMLRDDARLFAPGRWVQGRDSVLAVLRAHAPNATARATWVPIRVGISADGTHGFTIGYQTVQETDTVRHAKYVAYWIRGAAGWRVVAYKRVVALGIPSVPALLPSVLPAQITSAAPSSTVMDAYRASLRAAEIAFSDDAGKRGIGPAFEAFGTRDATNVGGPSDTTFVWGNLAIAQAVGAGARPDHQISWAPDEVFVAPSGDLGVSIGMIRITRAGSETLRVPYLTVWRRASLSDPWRYIAE